MHPIIRIATVSFPVAIMATLLSALYSTYVTVDFAYSIVGYGYPFPFYLVFHRESLL